MRTIHCFAILFLFVGTSAFAETRQKVNIDHATVFLNGAELTSSVKLNIPQGESEVLLTNIAGNINLQSLSVGSDNSSISVQSATFQNNYLETDNLSPRAKVIKDSIEQIESDRNNTNNQMAVVAEQIAILSQNKQVSGLNTGLSVTELQKMLDLLKARLGALLSEKDKFSIVLRKTDERLALLRKQLEEEKQKYIQPGGQVLVKFYASKSATSNITISYVTPNAGWKPSYNIRVDKLNDPVKLFYKADVFQNSGVKWDNVNITLSTGNPSEGAQAPVFTPWYLSFNHPVPYRTRQYGAVMEDNQAMGAGQAYSKNAEPATIDQYVSVNNSGISTSFDIDIPYTIPSDGKHHMIAIKKYELPASYSYYAMPKSDRDAFLQARVTNWENLDLLPATTNIFYEGTYVGQGFIDTRNTKDTMNFSLGRDKKIIVLRERDKELRSVHTIGSNVRQSFAYTLKVRNTRKEPINITIIDQVPVSSDKDITVEDKELSGAEYDETTGEVKWTLKLNPNETKELKIGYTIRYPKGKNINI